MRAGAGRLGGGLACDRHAGSQAIGRREALLDALPESGEVAGGIVQAGGARKTSERVEQPCLGRGELRPKSAGGEESVQFAVRGSARCAAAFFGAVGSAAPVPAPRTAETMSKETTRCIGGKESEIAAD